MSTDTPSTQGPTPKMLEFAKGIAKRLKLELPGDVENSFDACKGFIDTNKDAANAIPLPPSDKQLSFATSIAQKKGATIPPDVLANAKALSKWIDDNKG